MINKHRISFSHVRLYAYFLNWRNSTETSHLRETKPAPKRRLSAKYLPLLFLDVSSAFDKVWHNGLLAKLNQIGVDGTFHNTISSYLAGRKQVVVVDGIKSDTLG